MTAEENNQIAERIFKNLQLAGHCKKCGGEWEKKMIVSILEEYSSSQHPQPLSREELIDKANNFFKYLEEIPVGAKEFISLKLIQAIKQNAIDFAESLSLPAGKQEGVTDEQIIKVVHDFYHNKDRAKNEAERVIAELNFVRDVRSLLTKKNNQEETNGNK